MNVPEYVSRVCQAHAEEMVSCACPCTCACESAYGHATDCVFHHPQVARARIAREEVPGLIQKLKERQ